MLIHWEVVQFKLTLCIDGQPAGHSFIIIMPLLHFSLCLFIFHSLNEGDLKDFVVLCNNLKLQIQVCS